jgi:CheY-like chemotaxis protein
MNAPAQPVLLVEDNEDDVFIFQRAFRQAQLTHPIQVVGDGEEAADYLLGAGSFADRTKHPVPCALLLDLKLPLKGGLEVLQLVRETPAFAGLCVVVLTSSAEERDVARAYELGAQAYLVKPPSPRMLQEAFALIRAKLDGAANRDLPRIAGDRFADREPVVA